MIGGDKIVHGDEYDVAGDVNNVTVGAGAQIGQFAVGRNINQTSITSYQDEKKELADKLEQLVHALQALEAKLDASTIQIGTVRSKPDQLARTDGAYNVERIQKAADGLVKNAPAIGGPLGAALQTAAAQKILAQAGATDWAKEIK